LPSGQPGDLIRQREIPAPAGAKGWQMLYLSTSATGGSIGVSGVVYTPAGPAPASGLNLVGWAHGTTGLGDQCAPSKEAAQLQGSELLLATAVLGQGLAFTYTDYEGLGTPGVHTYLVGQSEGRTVLDALRAARHLLGLPTTSKSVIWGHSQGGGAALMAAELAPTYAPDANVVGSIAGAPAAELTSATAPTTELGFVLMAVAGFHAAYPTLPLAEVATAEGQATIGQIASQCLDEILRAYHGKDPAAYLKGGAVAAPGWSEALERNDPGHTATSVPIFIYHGDRDTTVPPAVSAAVTSSYCGLGVTVDRKVYPGTNHISVVPAALGDIFAYARDRLAAKPAPSTC
jgi:pimeloyl-ACP methyl ester carboxylesterase